MGFTLVYEEIERSLAKLAGMMDEEVRGKKIDAYPIVNIDIKGNTNRRFRFRKFLYFHHLWTSTLLSGINSPPCMAPAPASIATIVFFSVDSSTPFFVDVRSARIFQNWGSQKSKRRSIIEYK